MRHSAYASCVDRRGNTHRFDWNAQHRCAIPRRHRKDNGGDSRMEMNVLVRVDVVDGQSGRPEGLKLGGDFGGELATGAST